MHRGPLHREEPARRPYKHRNQEERAPLAREIAVPDDPLEAVEISSRPSVACRPLR